MVDRDFLIHAMKCMGFSYIWCQWIEQCINTASFSILVNGIPSIPFSTSNGLRQGDPLAPYLFTLTMEAFTLMIQQAEHERRLEAMDVECGHQALSYHICG